MQTMRDCDKPNLQAYNKRMEEERRPRGAPHPDGPRRERRARKFKRAQRPKNHGPKRSWFHVQWRLARDNAKRMVRNMKRDAWMQPTVRMDDGKGG